MKKLFLYYSLTGNGDEVASMLSSRGYELRKVVEKKKAPKSFFFRVLFGGFRAGLGLKGKLVGYDPDVSSYEEIVIGSPIWNGRFPPAVNAVLAKTDFSSKKVTFLFYSGSGEAGKALRKAKSLFPEALTLVLKEPKTHPEQYDKIASL